MDNIIESYLISLGVQPNIASFRQLESLMAQADNTVDRHTDGMLKSVLKVQIGIVSAFTSMSAAAIGLADKVAMADQSYRLFSLRMMTTQETGRKLKMIMDGLGASMEELFWDPEQRRRAGEMGQWIDHLSQTLGPNFAQNMVGIRDVRMQFTELTQALQFLGMATASKLFEKLGIDAGSLHEWLEKMSLKIPHLADVFSTALVPVLRDTKEMFKDIIGAGEGAALMFTNTIGALTGDTAIEGETLKFENFAKALEHVINAADRVFKAITRAEDAIATLDPKKLTPGAGAVVAGVGAGALGAAAAPFVGAGVTAALAPFIGPFALPVGIAAAAATPAAAALLSGGAVYGAGRMAADAKQASGTGFEPLFDAMAKIEGFGLAGALPTRLNNPGDLMYAGQKGAHRGDAGFAAFDTLEQGRAAGLRQLAMDAARGDSLYDPKVPYGPGTLGQEIYKWDKTNPEQYLANLATSGYGGNTKLSDIQSNITVHVTVANQPGSSAEETKRMIVDAGTQVARKLASSDRQFIQAQLSPAF